MPRTSSKSMTKRTQKSKATERDGQSLTPRGGVLSLQETANYLRVAEADVLDMITSQALPGRKIGQEWRFLKSALKKWLSTPPKKGLLSHFGAIKNDPNVEEFLNDVYERRRRNTMHE